MTSGTTPNWEEALARMRAAEDTLRAITAGEVDAFVVADGAHDQRVFTLATADRPYRIFVENMRDGAATVSPTGLVLYANDRLAALLRTPRSSIVGQRLERFLTGAGVPGLIARLADPQAIGGTIEVTLRSPDENTRPALVGHSPLQVDGERFTCLTFTDLAESKLQEAEILRLNRVREMQVADVREEFAVNLAHTQKLEALGVLASGIAHDFNNLVGIIQGNVSLLLQGLSPDSPDREALSDIQLAATRSADLTRQLLAYAGKGDFVVDEIDLRSVVRDLAPLIRSAISMNITLDVTMDEDTPPILADATQLVQVVLNLLTNASEAIGKRPGTITVSTGCLNIERRAGDGRRGELSNGPHAVLKVGDTGPGMDAETQSRIFDPFFTTKGSGRGLGLAAIQGIVHQHHGVMSVESRAGAGTLFTIIFPAAQDADPNLAEPPAFASSH